jgi:hypothetical protein
MASAESQATVCVVCVVSPDMDRLRPDLIMLLKEDCRDLEAVGFLRELKLWLRSRLSRLTPESIFRTAEVGWRRVLGFSSVGVWTLAALQKVDEDMHETLLRVRLRIFGAVSSEVRCSGGGGAVELVVDVDVPVDVVCSATDTNVDTEIKECGVWARSWGSMTEALGDISRLSTKFEVCKNWR